MTSGIAVDTSERGLPHRTALQSLGDSQSDSVGSELWIGSQRKDTVVRAAAITLAFCFGCTLANGEDPVQVARIFSAKDITTVIFRGGAAKQTKILRVYGDTIRVTGTPVGGAKGYQGSNEDPNWKETPASEWGLDFEQKRFGGVLVISTKNEIVFMHHIYRLEDIEITAPLNVRITLEVRTLNGDGAPDLSPP